MVPNTNELKSQNGKYILIKYTHKFTQRQGAMAHCGIIRSFHIQFSLSTWNPDKSYCYHKKNKQFQANILVENLLDKHTPTFTATYPLGCLWVHQTGRPTCWKLRSPELSFTSSFTVYPLSSPFPLSLKTAVYCTN